jgi:hypothetical protein
MEYGGGRHRTIYARRNNGDNWGASQSICFDVSFCELYVCG